MGLEWLIIFTAQLAAFLVYKALEWLQTANMAMLSQHHSNWPDVEQFQLPHSMSMFVKQTHFVVNVCKQTHLVVES